MAYPFQNVIYQATNTYNFIFCEHRNFFKWGTHIECRNRDNNQAKSILKLSAIN
jgi:hypothetical protein